MVTQRELDDALEAGGNFRHGGDVERIRCVAASAGLAISGATAERIWEEWSDAMAAGWLVIRDDVEILQAISAFVDRRKGD